MAKSKNLVTPIAIGVIGLVLGALAMFGLSQIGGSLFSLNQSNNTSISVQIRNSFPVSEVVTYQLEYDEIITNEQNADLTILDWTIAEWVDKKALVVLHGSLKLGFNGENLSITEDGNRLIINVPRMEVLGSSVSEEYEVYDQQGNYSVEETLELTTQKKEEIAQAYEMNENYIMQAQESSKTFLLSLIQSIPGVENYEIIFEFEG